jgi:hypothetical protein
MPNSGPAISGDGVRDFDPRQDQGPERSAEDRGHQSPATTPPAARGPVPKTWTKMDLINELAAVHGYHSYLEICTPTTGKLYATVDRDRYTTCHRLMYRCPDKFEDGFPIDFRTSGLDIERHLRVIRAVERKYDVILVDPFHEYETTIRDLREACDLLRPNGTILVHDCFPTDEKIVVPRYQNGSWCGVTYKAYIDFVLATPRLWFCTVDTDFGCGVIRQPAQFARDDRAALPFVAESSRRLAIRDWEQAGSDYGKTFRLLQAHATTLLNLVTVEEFLAVEQAGTALFR